MLYILLIVLALIIDSPWPVVAGIVLLLFANWEPTTPHQKLTRRVRKIQKKRGR